MILQQSQGRYSKKEKNDYNSQLEKAPTKHSIQHDHHKKFFHLQLRLSYTAQHQHYLRASNYEHSLPARLWSACPY